MRIHRPLQRQTDHRWDYTISSDEEGWTHADGYCAGWREWTLEDARKVSVSEFGVRELLERQEERRKFQHKYHRDGHSSADQAALCYRAYELDQKLEFFNFEQDTQRKCEVCTVWTMGYARLGDYRTFPLCPEHQSRANVERLVSLDEDGGDVEEGALREMEQAISDSTAVIHHRLGHRGDVEICNICNPKSGLKA
jgi:hypothetical protein